MEKLLDKFLRYVSVETTSDENSESQPSTAKQLNLLKMLRDELQAMGIKAELDDADLDVKYNVLGFNLNYYDSMGNTIVKTSTGTDFTNDQKDVMRKMSKGKKFYISRVRAKGPNGIEKILPPIEVIVN